MGDRDLISEQLAKYDASKKERHDPGQLIILFDNRIATTKDDRFSTYQSYWTAGLYRLGWPSLYKADLDPGNIRLVWYTHTGNEGKRDYPLYQAYTVKEMFDSLSEEGFRPMVLGWSGENPFPMIGGAEPPPEPKKPKIRVATSWSGASSGHGGAKGSATTPHDRVMAIITEEERREAEKRAQEVERMESNEKGEKGGLLSPV